MWIHLDETQLGLVKDAMLALAEGSDRDAALFWTSELKEARERLEQQARDYRAIAGIVGITVDPCDPHRQAAQKRANDDLEIDDDAIVSAGDDPGAWVHAWIWITDEEAGLFTCEECHCQFTLDRRVSGPDQICDDCSREIEELAQCEDCGNTDNDGSDICPDCSGVMAS